MRSFRAFIHTIKVHMGLSIARPMFQFVIWLSPFFLSTLAIFIYGASAPDRIFNYVVLGSGFMALWTSIVYSSASDVNRERYYGTLEIIFVSPTSFAITLLGKICGNTLWGLLSMLLSCVYLIVIFGVDLTIQHPLLFGGSFILVLVALSVFSFFLSLAFTLSRQAEALMNFIEYPIYLICGFMFPVTILPNWVQPLSYLLPPTWAIELLRQAATEQVSAAFNTTLYALLLITVIYFILGMLCYRAVLRKARVIGKLGVY
ncbi:ABC transporter permease [Paenibacillus albiflavus]|uniref:ABC transporter permease n=1 Tax=Paenibacillus albiflavus TaxID=2545760 RepID=A0A4R4E255_9BACL|nr:ABC transporter permease [Paenibacillus albiflavus]TCZ72295.1 ABC transporter permease [Paenibacillus albiflavus]